MVTCQSNVVPCDRDGVMWQCQVSLLDVKSLNAFLHLLFCLNLVSLFLKLNLFHL